jgi:glycosyl hydrolase family 123
MFHRCVLMCALVLPGVVHGAETVKPAPLARVQLVDSSTRWRYFLVSKTEEAKLESGEIQTVKFVKSGLRSVKMVVVKASTRSPLPPDAWRSPEFDDGTWPRRRLAVASTRAREHSLICARAQFRVGDPARLADATLSISYRGGVVVYLNGVELTRSHLPKGKINPDTRSDDYPKEAYLNPKGFLMRMGWGDPGRYKDRFAKRTRAVKDFAIPAAKLRKGVNTLALELHRPATDMILHTGKAEKYNSHRWTWWATLGLGSVTLSVPANSPGLATAASGLHVTNLSTLRRLIVGDGGDPCRAVRPVRLSGARNGAFTGRVLVSSLSPIKGLTVTASDLKGAAVIPAAAVQVRYGQPNGSAYRRRGPATYDGLALASPATIAVVKGSGRAAQPVWITINVPKDAKPGDYAGALTVSAKDADDVAVPIKLSVADWTLPDVKDFASWFGLVQSPESLAMHYKVPMWSEKHWALIDRSFELMGQVGTRIVYIPLIRRSHFGNPHSMVRWIKKADGTWDHDFSIFEKYIDTALKRLGKLDVIVLHSWGCKSGGAYMARNAKESASLPMYFTQLDPKTGVLTEAKGPTWNSPDITAFWKPVFDGIRARLEKRGVAKAMMLGIAQDTRPSKRCQAVLKQASGDLPWVAHTHPRTWRFGTSRVGYLADVWSSPRPTLDFKRRRYGWKETRFVATFPRYGSNTVGKLGDYSPLLMYRVAPESAICAGIKGYGWIGADFWPVVKTRHGMRSLLDRYPEYDRRGNLGIAHTFVQILRPGKTGPVASSRLEMVRQGAQETEARVFIERILLDPAKKAKLGADLAGRCQALLDGRVRALVSARTFWDMLVWLDWEKQKADLFALASEVAATQ